MSKQSKPLSPYKVCKDFAEAEKYQNRLYNVYNTVVLVSFPFNNVIGKGLYVWSVSY